MNELDFLKQKEVREFILENTSSDVNALLLNPPQAFKEHIHLIVEQLLARQKAKGKLDEWLEHPEVLFPPPLSIEQASSISTGNYKSSLVSGNQLIDLTGGMGIDCLSLSKGFKTTTYVEENPMLCARFRHNSGFLSSQTIEIHNEEAASFLQRFDGTSTFYLDPARRDNRKNKVFKLEDCSPDLIELMQLFREKASQVLVKLSPLLDLTAVLNEINHVKEVHIVSVKNDCKELLLLIDFAYTGSPKIVAVNLETDQPAFTFQAEQEQNTTITYGEPEAFIYEPNASVLKAGAFKSIADQFDLLKVAPNTHLYGSSRYLENFPGRVYEIIEDASKKTLSAFTKSGTINVVTRNYPLSPAEIKKKYKIKDGGDLFLIGYRNSANKPKLVIAKRPDR